ncbi:hypothetical protein D9613_007767 [Agrocybe pediades]|uniref:Uncharacterized protein n=1 Tax=Agrocybe pediades TaxID=84607 RepID=A0A8H4QM88_9AGAR|nr:hypothetical protein D9613_007767 [Agrocybe pediades]
MSEPVPSNESLDILESALDQAFTAPLTVEVEAPAKVEEPIVAQEAKETAQESVQDVESSQSSSLEDSWKAEYEAQVQSWRARSAEEREKAEKERLRWEAIRAIEKEEAAKRKAAGIPEETNDATVPQLQVEENWENVPRDAASTEPTNTLTLGDSTFLSPLSTQPEPPTAIPTTQSQNDSTPADSQKWENVASVTSSYPSLSFPEHTESPPSQPEPAPQQAPVSVTLAIFDSSLSTRTRVTALFSSLAVNLLLPFVNGVMLGFGEIFAKNVVMGWFNNKFSGSGSTAANVGLKSSSREQRKKSSIFG